MNAINDVDTTTCAQFLDFWPQKEGKEDSARRAEGLKRM